MIGRCANVSSLEDRMMEDENFPDTRKLIGREGGRQGTEVMAEADRVPCGRLSSTKVRSCTGASELSLYVMPGKPLALSVPPRKLLSVTVFILSLGGTTSAAQLLQYKEPEEVLVKQYEKLRADGALLSPEGWARVSRLFERPRPYPANSEILLISSPGIIGRTSADGDRARVDTKWGDSCGTIDSHLRYKPMPVGGCIMTEEAFSLVFVHRPLHKLNGAQANDTGEWKIEAAPQTRAADIPAAIKYVEAMRNKSNDPAVQKNASQTIRALRRLRAACGVPNPC